ncbi:hypothetical protein [Phytohabitans houttuyneae]|jgi:hypothetical protein|uniref:Uncharacterized protein n=1 Tax=Phytohabitans houttuyneae TaxID=1076126 RepID=A0A6V8K733_9ACTN|nr:hypothetical protein [Phytohabitans houttuyneae]GFJ77557.1 hypothetical protein Phou_017370 [Phytohabitans houttuyneae]
MPRLLPRISPEPPPEYIEFVELHLDALRKDAARVVGTEHDADCLYPDVLTDVAARWGWLKLQRRLRQADAVDLYLRRAFTRRADSWRAPDLLPLESLDEAWPVEIQVWSTGSIDPPPPSPPSQRIGSSFALRLAPHLDPTQRPQAGPLAEAAVAWWHACEARRRRRRIAAGMVALVLLALMNRLPQHPSTRSLEWVDKGVAVSSTWSTVSI